MQVISRTKRNCIRQVVCTRVKIDDIDLLSVLDLNRQIISLARKDWRDAATQLIPCWLGISILSNQRFYCCKVDRHQGAACRVNSGCEVLTVFGVLAEKGDTPPVLPEGFVGGKPGEMIGRLIITVGNKIITFVQIDVVINFCQQQIPVNIKAAESTARINPARTLVIAGIAAAIVELQHGPQLFLPVAVQPALPGIAGEIGSFGVAELVGRAGEIEIEKIVGDLQVKGRGDCLCFIPFPEGRRVAHRFLKTHDRGQRLLKIHGRTLAEPGGVAFILGMLICPGAGKGNRPPLRRDSPAKNKQRYDNGYAVIYSPSPHRLSHSTCN